ncbi:MAG: hypothetical protein ACHQ1D_00400 [Nitrososphaerales archaeon]
MDKLYSSLFSDLKISAAEHITELICQKKALKDKTTLSQNFWQLPKWKTVYVREISQAHILLKTYSEKAIVAAINHPSMWAVTSLRNGNLLPIIKEEQDKVKNMEFVGETSSEVNTSKPFGRNKFGGL